MRYSSARGGVVVAVAAAALNLWCARKLPQPKVISCLGLRDLGVGAVTDVCVQGSIAFSATRGILAPCNGLSVVDVSNPESPRVVGDCSFHPVNQIDVRGHYLYATHGGDSSVLVINVHEPAKPECVGGCAPSASPDGICVLDERWVCAVDDAGVLAMLDVSNPGCPFVTSRLKLHPGATDICARAPYVYVANGFSGLQVVDVSDPYAPVLAGSWTTDEYPCQVCIEGHYAYVALQRGGLGVLDISKPREPTLVAQYGKSLQGWALCVKGAPLQ